MPSPQVPLTFDTSPGILQLYFFYSLHTRYFPAILRVCSSAFLLTVHLLCHSNLQEKMNMNTLFTYIKSLATITKRSHFLN